jgi:hypothetical protein
MFIVLCTKKCVSIEILRSNTAFKYCVQKGDKQGKSKSQRFMKFPLFGIPGAGKIFVTQKYHKPGYFPKFNAKKRLARANLPVGSFSALI